MDPNISLISASVLALGGIASYVYSEMQLRKARKLNERTKQLAAETEQVAKAALKSSLATLFPAPRSPFLSSMPIASESISVSEAVAILKAAGIPTPGCGCDECDALRLARAAKQAEK